MNIDNEMAIKLSIDFDEFEIGDMVIHDDDDVWYVKHIFSDGFIMIEKDGGMETSQGAVKEIFYTDI